MQKKRRSSWMVLLIMILMSGMISFNEACRTKRIYLSTNELGEIDFFGYLIKGEINPASPHTLDIIKSKDLCIVSKGLILHYWELKNKPPEQREGASE